MRLCLNFYYKRNTNFTTFNDCTQIKWAPFKRRFSNVQNTLYFDTLVFFFVFEQIRGTIFFCKKVMKLTLIKIGNMIIFNGVFVILSTLNEKKNEYGLNCKPACISNWKYFFIYYLSRRKTSENEVWKVGMMSFRLLGKIHSKLWHTDGISIHCIDFGIFLSNLLPTCWHHPS